MSREKTIAIIGGGMAGIAAAAAACEAGAARVKIFEAHDQLGGAARESAGWFWVHRDTKALQNTNPDGDFERQRILRDEFAEAGKWLESHGVEKLQSSTGREQSIGVQYDLANGLPAMVKRLAKRFSSLKVHAGERVSSWPLADAVILSGGGYVSDLEQLANRVGLHQAPSSWIVRPSYGGDGSAQQLAIAAGASYTYHSPHALIRLVPVSNQPIPHNLLAWFGEIMIEGVRLFGGVQFNGAHTEITRDSNDWLAAQQLWRFAESAESGWIEIGNELLDFELHSGSLRELLAALELASIEVQRSDDICRVRVRAGFTNTTGGLITDTECRVLDLGGKPIANTFAAGCDCVSVAPNTFASGLAQALVFGRRAGYFAAQ